MLGIIASLINSNHSNSPSSIPKIRNTYNCRAIILNAKKTKLVSELSEKYDINTSDFLYIKDVANASESEASKSQAKKVSIWVTSAHSRSDVLWENLVYTFLIDNVVVMYTPRFKLCTWNVVDKDIPCDPAIRQVYSSFIPGCDVTASARLCEDVVNDYLATLWSHYTNQAVGGKQLNHYRRGSVARAFSGGNKGGNSVPGGRSNNNNDEKFIPIERQSSLVTFGVTSNNKQQMNNNNNTNNNNDNVEQWDNRRSPLPIEKSKIRVWDEKIYLDRLQVPCTTCNCQWFVSHPSSPSFCRVCFHDHKINHLYENPLPSGIMDTTLHNILNMTTSENMKQSTFSNLYGTSSSSFVAPALEVAHLRELVTSLDPQNILTLLTALFAEHKVIFASHSIYKLRAVTSILIRLLYPFSWKHVYLPYIQPNLISMLTMSRPFIAGVHISFVPVIQSISGVFVADLDHNMVRYPTDESLHTNNKPGLMDIVPIIDADPACVPAGFHFPQVIRFALRQALVRFISKIFLVGLGSDSTDSISPLSLSNIKTSRNDIITQPLQLPDVVDKEKKYEDIAVLERLDELHRTEHEIDCFSKQVDDLRVISDAKELQLSFVKAYTSLFFKYKLFWCDEDTNQEGVGKLDTLSWFDHTDKAFQSFITRFSKTESFNAYISAVFEFSNFSFSTNNLFDALVCDQLRSHCLELEQRRNAICSGEMMYCKGKEKFKRRYLMLTSDQELLVYKNKSILRVKAQFTIKPNSWTLIVPNEEPSTSYATFYLHSIIGKGQTRNAQICLTFRAETVSLRDTWVKLLRAKLMSPELVARYEMFRDAFE